jgi:branched-subunit amino acid aminotransferase/4-amino-4-deoxychorismate lyase
MPDAFLNGRFVSAADAVVPVTDAGFLLGATVAEQLRTFGGNLFRLDQHLDRLWHSLEIVGTDPRLSRDELAGAAEELVRRNYSLLSEGDDLGLTIFATPGPYPTYVPEGGPPLVGVHTFPLPFTLWENLYDEGQALRVTEIRQVPSTCWPSELKCRSRMHYFLADQHARAAEPGSRALLLDDTGHVVEASTANLVIVDQGGVLVSPPREKILPGISVAVLSELAGGLGLEMEHREMTPADVAAAREVMLTSTSPCLLPVTRFNGTDIADGRPGDVFQRLLAAWSEHAGLDIRAQARRFAQR